MSNVRDLLRKFRDDNTVKEKKEWDGKPIEAPKRAPPPRSEQPAESIKRVGSGSTVTQHPVPPTRQSPDAPARETAPLAKLDPDCPHAWQWKGGVKSCWLCGGAAPVDRRDSTTRWRG